MIAPSTWRAERRPTSDAASAVGSTASVGATAGAAAVPLRRGVSPQNSTQQRNVQQPRQQQQQQPQQRRRGIRSSAVTPQGTTPAPTRPPSPRCRRGGERPLGEDQEPESEPTARAQEKNQAEVTTSAAGPEDVSATKDNSDRSCEDPDSGRTMDRTRPHVSAIHTPQWPIQTPRSGAGPDTARSGASHHKIGRAHV